MMESLQYFLLVLLLAGCDAIPPILSKSYDVQSIRFNKSETFWSDNNYIHHIEPDLYKNDGSLLFLDHTTLLNTDGKTVSTVASGFGSYPHGFKQFNSSHVYVADTSNHCIKLVNRESKSTTVVAGQCGSVGLVDGRSAKFSAPQSIVVDERNPRQLIISDYANKALRSFDIDSGYVSILIRSGLINPWGMAWFNDRLLVCNLHYISEVVWDENGTATNTILAGSSSAGFVDGDFSVARFNTPRSIGEMQDGLYIVSDVGNGRLRLLNMFERKVSPVCIGAGTDCTTSTSFTRPYAPAVRANGTTYIGSGLSIHKMSGYQCYTENVTVYVYPDQEKARVPLDSDNVAYLQPGEYHFSQKLGADSCPFFVHVLVSPVVRTAVFRSEYDVTCDTLESAVSRAFLHSILAHRKEELQAVCGGDCQMSTRAEPWFKCEKDLLTVSWPTMAVYPVDVKDVPAKYRTTVLSKLKDSDVYDPEIVIISHDPPLVKAKANSDGETVQLTLSSSCATKSQSYDAKLDKCS